MWGVGGCRCVHMCVCVCVCVCACVSVCVCEMYVYGCGGMCVGVDVGGCGCVGGCGWVWRCGCEGVCKCGCVHFNGLWGHKDQVAPLLHKELYGNRVTK